MKCSKCGRVIISRLGEKAVICSCCNKIECFECAGIETYEKEKKDGDDDGD